LSHWLYPIYVNIDTPRNPQEGIIRSDKTVIDAAAFRREVDAIREEMVETIRSKALEILLPLLKECEGCRLHAYRDSVGVWTIGYGHTQGVTPGQCICQEEADLMLEREAANFLEQVGRCVTEGVSANQLAAMTSLAYNIGVGAFRKSTLLRRVNEGKPWLAADEFLRWDKGGGRKIAGLTHRRQKERAIFLRETDAGTDDSPREPHAVRA
jgi:lysozyme